MDLNASPGIGTESGMGRISARVFDAYATGIPNQTVTFSVSVGTLAAEQIATDQQGYALTTMTAPPGSVTVGATVAAPFGPIEATTRLAIQALPPPAGNTNPGTPPSPTPTPPNPTPTPPTPTPVPPTLFTKSGTGNDVFDMPTSVARVRITGTFTGTSSNFIVRIGGDLVVNVIIGTSQGLATMTTGVYLTSGGVVAITNSDGVAWSFTEVR
jgi:Bacterial Ig-like domain (group 1)